MSQAQTARHKKAAARLLEIMAPITVADLERERRRIERAYKVRLKPMSASFLVAVAPHKRPEPHDLRDVLEPLPAGQCRVAAAVLDGGPDTTYPKLADQLGIHLGTLHRHLQRIRERHPEIYQHLIAARSDQLATRHDRAEQRAVEHSARWHRKQSARRYHRQFGRWPWDR